MGKQGYISVSITVLSYLACPEWILSSVDKIIPLFLIFLINFQKTWNRCVLIENLYQFFSKEIYVASNRILIVTSRGCEISWYHTAEHYPTMPVMGERCILIRSSIKQMYSFDCLRCGEMQLFRFSTQWEWRGEVWSQWPASTNSTTTVTEMPWLFPLSTVAPVCLQGWSFSLCWDSCPMRLVSPSIKSSLKVCQQGCN